MRPAIQYVAEISGCSSTQTTRLVTALLGLVAPEGRKPGFFELPVARPLVFACFDHTFTRAVTVETQACSVGKLDDG